MRLLLFAFFASITVLAGVGNLAARDGSSSRSVSAARETQPAIPNRNRSERGTVAERANAKRLREGTMITDATGHFREDGDGASFVTDGGLEFGALQNLNLERVVRLLKGADEPSSIRWSVTGSVTEYNGRNYILLKRSVYKSATPPPAPDRVAQ
ncbi:MAG: hypothetical protein AAGD11_20235 [Planctomycetota bacterium]